ncbi:putative CS domain containing protein [Leishmania shawi]|uniref:CS domain containing protein n=1 Tax=Leishmania shawi TaxID=5680 RepID=A0AAW3B6Z6_9TRYP
MSHLPIKWAERKDRVFITVEAMTASDVHVTFQEKTVSISGNGVTAKGSEPHTLKGELHLLKEIVPEDSTFKVLGVSIQICAMKKDQGYWNRLVEEPTKLTKSWLSADWNLWKDEDDEAEEDAAASNFGGYGDMGGMDMASMMGGMGGMGGMDMESMMASMGKGAGGDSDDEEMADSEGEEQADDECEKSEEPAADISDLNA